MSRDRIRAEFERIFSGPPYEFDMDRFGELEAWSENYRNYNVQCAWAGFEVCANLQAAKPEQAQTAVGLPEPRWVRPDDLEVSLFAYYDIDDLQSYATAKTAEAVRGLVEFAEEVRRSGDTRLASMAIAVLAKYASINGKA